MSWDTRSTNTLECLKTPLAEVESMAVSGCNLIVAVGSSVNIYDLRNFNKSVYAKELFPGFQIRCVRTILNSEGIMTKVYVMFSHFSHYWLSYCFATVLCSNIAISSAYTII